MNTDAHIGETRSVGLGVVVRDGNGVVVVAAVRGLEVRWKVEQAELAASRYGVQLARRLRLSKIN